MSIGSEFRKVADKWFGFDPPKKVTIPAPIPAARRPRIETQAQTQIKPLRKRKKGRWATLYALNGELESKYVSKRTLLS
jgi:hypothetical protein